MFRVYDTVDGSEILHHLDGAKTRLNHGINYQPQLVQDFFHQQHLWSCPSDHLLGFLLSTFGLCFVFCGEFPSLCHGWDRNVIFYVFSHIPMVEEKGGVLSHPGSQASFCKTVETPKPTSSNQWWPRTSRVLQLLQPPHPPPPKKKNPTSSIFQILPTPGPPEIWNPGRLIWWQASQFSRLVGGFKPT